MPLKFQYIYGLFGRISGDCLYVGCTDNPKQRYHSHLSNRTTNGTPFVFTILKHTSRRYGAREEARTIRHYRSIGQAQFNGNERRCSLTRTMNSSDAIKFVKNIHDGAVLFATPSDKAEILKAARGARRLKIREVYFKVHKMGAGFRLTAIIIPSEVEN